MCSDARRARSAENKNSIVGQINDTDTCIGDPSVGRAEKAGRKADSVQSLESRQDYETERKSENLSVKVFNWI